MTVMMVDRIAAVVFHGGVLRVECMMTGPNNAERPSGTLLIPGVQSAQILQALIGATKELDRRLREQNVQTQAPATPTPQ